MSRTVRETAITPGRNDRWQGAGNSLGDVGCGAVGVICLHLTGKRESVNGAEVTSNDS